MTVLFILSIIVMGLFGICALFGLLLSELNEDRITFVVFLGLCTLVIVTLSLAIARIP